MATPETAAKTNGAKAAPPAAKTENPLSLVKRTVIDVVAEKVNKFIENGELNLPKDYSVNNAIKSAWLILQSTVDKDSKPAMEICTRDSIANSLLDMVVQGLNPGKKQAYFIVYGKTLTCQRSYFGSMAVAKMVQPKIDDFAFAVVYEGDTFKYGIKNGKKIVTDHEQDIQNVDRKKIVAAYCIALDKEGNPFRTEIATFDEIKQAWRQSKMNPFDDKGNVKDFSTHAKFTSEMALKTVINKCCKAIINSSSDCALLLDRINRNQDLADRAEAEAEIEEEANTGKVIEIETTTQDKDETEAPVSCPLQEKTKQVGQPSRMPGF
jgi:recombination protein RecT